MHFISIQRLLGLLLILFSVTLLPPALVAWLYQDAGNPEGLKYAERAYELLPGRPEKSDTLGWLLVVSISFYLTYVAVFIFGAYVIFAKDHTYDPTLPSYFGLTFFALAFIFYGNSISFQ